MESYLGSLRLDDDISSLNQGYLTRMHFPSQWLGEGLVKDGERGRRTSKAYSPPWHGFFPKFTSQMGVVSSCFFQGEKDLLQMGKCSGQVQV